MDQLTVYMQFFLADSLTKSYNPSQWIQLKARVVNGGLEGHFWCDQFDKDYYTLNLCKRNNLLDYLLDADYFK